MDEEVFAALRQFGLSLTQEQLDDLRTIHDELGFMCEAHGEGLWCCVDWILGDTGLDKVMRTATEGI